MVETHLNVVARPPRPLVRETMTDQIVAELTSAIANGHFPAGTRLVETKLAESMNSSRGPVREALRQLNQSGLVDIRPRRGCFVADLASTNWSEMVVMRAMLEGLAARIVASSSTDDDLDDLEQYARQIGEEVHDTSALRRADWRFHMELCRLAGNTLLLKKWTEMRDGISILMSQGRAGYADPTNVSASHVALVGVLRSHDPATCEEHFRTRLLKSGYSWLDSTVPEAFAPTPFAT